VQVFEKQNEVVVGYGRAVRLVEKDANLTAISANSITDHPLDGHAVGEVGRIPGRSGGVQQTAEVTQQPIRSSGRDDGKLVSTTPEESAVAEIRPEVPECLPAVFVRGTDAESAFHLAEQAALSTCTGTSNDEEIVRMPAQVLRLHVYFHNIAVRENRGDATNEQKRQE
jgi:hypothetical protein